MTHAQLGRGRSAGRLVVLLGVLAIVAFGDIVPATFLPVMAGEAIADPAVFSWAWPVFAITAAASTFAATGLATSRGIRRLWTLGHVVRAAGVVLPRSGPASRRSC